MDLDGRRSVLVVGAGPVGLITALGLAKAGVEVTVVEKEPAVVNSPRAMVYLWCVLGHLDRLGILDDVKNAGITGGGLHFRVYRTKEVIPLTLDVLDGEVPHPYNVHLGQNKLAEIALDHLGRLPGAAVHWNTEVTGVQQDESGVTVRTNTPDGPREFRAGWVIGTDGAGSRVRKELGLEFQGMTWPQRFVATNIRYDFALHGFNESNQMIDPQYGAVIAKIDDTGLWRCTYCEDDSLPEESITERMRDYFAESLPGEKEYELVQYSPYRMHQRAAETFRVGRVILAGDAAHATNPAGGLGLTSGLFDSFVLSEALAAVIHGEADDDVLDLYSDRRRKVFLDIASPQATGFKELVYHSSDPVALEAALSGLRAVSGDRDLQRQQFLSLRNLETPSLLSASA